MNFQENLKFVVDHVKGAKAAILMGFDGIPVAESTSGNSEMVFQDLAVEYSQMLSEAVKVGQANSLGGTREFTFETDKAIFVFRILKDNYFLGLLMTPDGLIGKGKYLLRRLSPEIQKEL